MSGLHRSSDESGFTLLEMLVVITIIGLASLVSIVSFRQSVELGIEKISQKIASFANLQRLKALNENAETEIAFDLKARTITINANEPALRIPDAITINLKIGAEVMSGEKARIVFYPDGSSSGAEMELISDRDATRSTLYINWLTGIPSMRYRE